MSCIGQTITRNRRTYTVVNEPITTSSRTLVAAKSEYGYVHRFEVELDANGRISSHVALIGTWRGEKMQA